MTQDDRSREVARLEWLDRGDPDNGCVRLHTADGRTHDFLMGLDVAVEAAAELRKGFVPQGYKGVTTAAIGAPGKGGKASLNVQSPGGMLSNFPMDDVALDELGRQIKAHLQGRAAKR